MFVSILMHKGVFSIKHKMNVWEIAAAAVLTALLLLTGCPNHAVGGPLFPNGSAPWQEEAVIVTLKDEDLVIEDTVLKGYKGNYPFDTKLVLNVPAYITKIDDNAFAYCNLTSVNLSGCTGLETIGEEAFSQCTEAEIRLPPLVKSIGKNAFGFYIVHCKKVIVPEQGTKKLVTGSPCSYQSDRVEIQP